MVKGNSGYNFGSPLGCAPSGVTNQTLVPVTDECRLLFATLRRSKRTGLERGTLRILLDRLLGFAMRGNIRAAELLLEYTQAKPRTASLDISANFGPARIEFCEIPTAPPLVVDFGSIAVGGAQLGDNGKGNAGSADLGDNGKGNAGDG